MWKNAIRTQMFNANICILCDVVKKVERREHVLLDILQKNFAQ